MPETLFEFVTVHCFFQRWCQHTITGLGPHDVHDRMEEHYRDAHYGKHLYLVQAGGA